MREAWNFERISLPESLVRQLGITRKECVKGVLLRVQYRERITSAFEIRPLTPIMETENGTRTPLNSGSMEKEIGLPATAIITHGSVIVIVFKGALPGLAPSVFGDQAKNVRQLQT